jgi:hypothetical protein
MSVSAFPPVTVAVVPVTEHAGAVNPATLLVKKHFAVVHVELTVAVHVDGDPLSSWQDVAVTEPSSPPWARVT